MKKIIAFLAALLTASVVGAAQPNALPAGRTYRNSPSALQTTAPVVVYSSNPVGALFVSTSTLGSPLAMSINATGTRL